jgi:NAD(P)-dependent dehydrogenase (short-subunit alcohol dehydrogenase family)
MATAGDAHCCTSALALHSSVSVCSSQRAVLRLTPTSGCQVGSIGDNRLGGWYSYRSSKAALNMLTRTMALEFERKRAPVACLLLHPGTCDTDLTRPFQKVQPPQRAWLCTTHCFVCVAQQGGAVTQRVACTRLLSYHSHSITRAARFLIYPIECECIPRLSLNVSVRGQLHPAVDVTTWAPSPCGLCCSITALRWLLRSCFGHFLG